jgi:hypothetical protein
MFWVLTGTPYFPVQIFLGLLVGFMVGRHLRHRAMLWVWAIPLAFLCYAFIAVPTFTPDLTPPEYQAGVGESRLSHYFGWGCQPKNHCIDQTWATLPFYIALSYSLGGLCAQSMPERLRRPNPRYFWIYLVIASLFLAAFVIDFQILIALFRQTGEWAYLRPLLVAAGLAAVFTLYAFMVRRSEPMPER